MLSHAAIRLCTYCKVLYRNPCNQRFYRDKRSYLSKIGKVVTQPVKKDPKFSGVTKERGYGVMTKKGRASVGKNRECMRVKCISYL